MYFANLTNSLELRSVASGNQLPLVATKSNTELSSCEFFRMEVSTMHIGWEELNLDGYSYSSEGEEGFISVSKNIVEQFNKSVLQFALTGRYRLH